LIWPHWLLCCSPFSGSTLWHESLRFEIYIILKTLSKFIQEELSRFGFGGIFRLVDLGLLFFSAQQPFIFQNILLRFGVIHCGVLLSPQENARCKSILISIAIKLNHKFNLQSFAILPSYVNCFCWPCSQHSGCLHIATTYLINSSGAAVHPHANIAAAHLPYNRSKRAKLTRITTISGLEELNWNYRESRPTQQ
jgi:hypothetical protein